MKDKEINMDMEREENKVLDTTLNNMDLNDELNKTDLEDVLDKEIDEELENIYKDIVIDEKSKGIVESILFASGGPVSITVLSDAIGRNDDLTKKILKSMMEERKKEEYGLDIVEINGMYQMCTKKEFADEIFTAFDERKKPKLTNAAFETLSIIAYNQNITRMGIAKIRGVGSDGIVSRLLEYGLIEESGKTDLPGRPMGYVTTDKFLLTFGISSLDEMPPLPEIKEEDLFFKEEGFVLKSESEDVKIENAEV